jgi:[ribosomal protein S18]-alanine N-acetyltransferase
LTEPTAARPSVEHPPPVQIRRLAYPDLPEVIAIERRVFVTPWSLAMFVLELSKQTGICLAAIDPGAEATTPPPPAGVPRPSLDAPIAEQPLIGYLICSRYDTVWHVMNVAVDLAHQRKGLASALLGELYGQAGGDRARYTLEVRRSNLLAIRLYEREGFRAAGIRRRYYQDNGEDALVMWRTPATLEGSLDDVPNPGPV